MTIHEKRHRICSESSRIKHFIMRQDDKTITLHTYSDVTEAKMVQDKLKESGIDSFLNDENVLGMDPIAGVELKVFEKDKMKAEMVIAAGN